MKRGRRGKKKKRRRRKREMKRRKKNREKEDEEKREVRMTNIMVNTINQKGKWTKNIDWYDFFLIARRRMGKQVDVLSQWVIALKLSLIPPSLERCGMLVTVSFFNQGRMQGSEAHSGKVRLHFVWCFAWKKMVSSIHRANIRSFQYCGSSGTEITTE